MKRKELATFIRQLDKMLRTRTCVWDRPKAELRAELVELIRVGNTHISAITEIIERAKARLEGESQKKKEWES